VADRAPGQVGTRTRFTYHEQDGKARAEHEGGDVLRGHLIGTREGDRLDFRHVRPEHDGTTSSGHCVSQVAELPDGRVGPAGTWERESRRAAVRAWWRSSPGTGPDMCRTSLFAPADRRIVTAMVIG
jgi:hypothetical protein